MPQMSHLMWMDLFIFFSIMYLIASIKIYFLHNPKNNPLTSFKMNKKTTINWVW